MTFYEAAVEVLKSASRPLHYKKITEIAIKRQLLSHVGKTPEVTMGTRLVQEVQRATETSEIVRTRPGVYALRAWENEPPAAGAALEAGVDEDGEASLAAEEPDETEGDRRRQRRRRRGGAEDAAAAQPPAARPPRDSSGERAAAPAAAAARDEQGPFSPVDLYADRAIFDGDDAEAEDEVDELLGDEDEVEAGAEGAEGAVSSRRRRRRRRRRRGGPSDGADGDARAATPPSPEPAASLPPPVATTAERAARAPRPERPAQPSRPQGAPRSEGTPAVAGAPDAAIGRELPGGSDPASMAAAALEVLRSAARPLDAEHLLQELGAGAGRVLAATLAAALVTDNRVREARGLRPHFVRLDDTRWGLTEWSLEKGVLRIEEHLQDAVHHLRRQTVEQLGVKLQELTVDTWQHLVLALLKHLGYAVLGIRRRDERTFVVRAEHRVGLSTVYVAIELCDCSELGAEAVTELRGTLHHHGSSRGVIFTTGRVSSEAVEESRIANLPPITLIGRDEMAQMLVDAGIGVHKLEIPVYYVDHGFFERLSGR